MNENVPAPTEQKSNFPIFKNVSQANRFVRKALDPRARVKRGTYNFRLVTDEVRDHTDSVVEAVSMWERRQGFIIVLNGLIIGSGSSINEACEDAYADELLPNFLPKYDSGPRRYTRKMLARRILGTRAGSLGGGGAEALVIADEMLS